MVSATCKDTYVRHTDKKPIMPSSKKEPTDKAKAQTSTFDTLYILDLSCHNLRNEQNTEQHDEPAAMLDLSQNVRKKLSNIKMQKDRGAGEVAAEGEGKPPDKTGRLKRMLVAAKSPVEVQSVLAEVFNHMREWIKLAAEGDKKAMAVVRKLNKLVSRGNRKIRDLNKEQVMLQRQQKAEKAQQEQTAQRLRDELKRAERERKRRERRYLQEKDEYKEDEPAGTGPSTVATEAKIRELAAAIAALKSNSAGIGDTGLSGTVTVYAGAKGTEADEPARPLMDAMQS